MEIELKSPSVFKRLTLVITLVLAVIAPVVSSETASAALSVSSVTSSPITSTGGGSGASYIGTTSESAVYLVGPRTSTR